MEGFKFYNIENEPFKIYGVYKAEGEEHFRRIPADVAEATSRGVFGLARHCAGGRVRFKTDSVKIAVRAKMINVGQMSHATPLMQYGFDLYQDAQSSKYIGSFKPVINASREYESVINVPAGVKELTLNFPLYGCVGSLEIGVTEDASISAHTPYKYENPIVYYGSSITQGGCTTRPGKSYQSIISRRLDYNYVNLGFSGNAKAEDVICEYMSKLTMSAFVCDYDHNAPNPEHLQNTHFKLYQTVRAAYPTIPYIMVSRPDFKYTQDDFERRAIIMESYIKARRSGDKNVYFVDGSEFFAGKGFLEMTVDGVHPTDDGFAEMAKSIGALIEKVFPWENMK